jgi:ATP-dependent 26S proteasome regulatory subunit
MLFFQGRIDRKIYVSPPDPKSREVILRLELAKMPLSNCVDHNAIVEMIDATEGFSGAEVVQYGTFICSSLFYIMQ